MITQQHFRHLMWHIFAATKGGENRIRIIELLKERPYNAHQMCKEMGVDYRTILHHIKILIDNQIIDSEAKRYGEMYFLTELFDSESGTFDEILNKLRKRNK